MISTPLPETWSEFSARIAQRRQENIAACNDPEHRDHLIATDDACRAVEMAARVAEEHRRKSHCLTNRRLNFPSSPQAVHLIETNHREWSAFTPREGRP